MKYFNLTPNEEIHILQLIREALSNIVQHAKASTAHLILQYKPSGNILITIEDNGIGMATKKTPCHHYGLSIMKERAQTLNGHLDISNKITGGTKIKLIFTPTNRAMPLNPK
jgi:two-component system nitrate/nitrite sensor histidine kinase NarX